MTEFDDIIREAREGLSPKPRDQERVWKRLSARVGVAATAGATAVLAAKTSAAATGAAAPGILAGQSLGALAKIVFGTMALTLAGAGVVVTVASPDAEPRTPALAVTPSTTTHVPSGPRSALAPTRVEAPVPSASAPRAELGSGSARRAVALEPTAEPSATSAAPRPDLAQELALLVEVRRASARAEHARARTLLDQLDAEQPNGALMEERAALRAISACEGGSGTVVAPGDEFVRQYPTSVYAAKVRRACRTVASTASSAPARFTDLDGDGH